MQSPAKHRHTLTSINLTSLLSSYVGEYDLGVVVAETALITLTRNDYLPDVCFFNKEKASRIHADQMKYPAPDLIVEVLSSSTEKNRSGHKIY